MARLLAFARMLLRGGGQVLTADQMREIVLTQRLFETAQAPAVHTDLQAAALAAAG